MGRRSSGGGGGFRSSPVARRSPPKPVAKSPAPAPAPNAQPTSNSSVTGGLGSAIADGIGWGVGTSIAHRAVDAIMGPRTIKMEEVPATAAMINPGTADACQHNMKAFGDCLNSQLNDISKCQFLMDMLTECKRNNSGAAESIQAF
ncbi:hypothetical protein QQ045_002149 [Rhodiola kirilowii]